MIKNYKTFEASLISKFEVDKRCVYYPVKNGDKITEARKIKEDLTLYNLEGIPMDEAIYKTPSEIMNSQNFLGVKSSLARDYMIKLINKQIGKKILFNNLKDTSIKKERILKGEAYWINAPLIKEWPSGPEIGVEWELILRGTVKNYRVDLRRPIGYYGPANKKIKFNPFDPYGEEIWD
jgi:hypothetical protein